jgi:hypothetical protein
MNSFQSIAMTKNTTLAVVAPGIAEALFATALGLFAAIPAVIAYNKISTAVDGLADRLGSFADEFGVVVSREIDNEPGGCLMAAPTLASRRRTAQSRRRRRRQMGEINVTPLRRCDAGAPHRLHDHRTHAHHGGGGRPAARRQLAFAGPGRAPGGFDRRRGHHLSAGDGDRARPARAAADRDHRARTPRPGSSCVAIGRSITAE